jgi:hypothetical protein
VQCYVVRSFPRVSDIRDKRHVPTGVCPPVVGEVPLLDVLRTQKDGFESNLNRKRFNNVP